MASQDGFRSPLLAFFEPLQLLQTKPYDSEFIGKQAGAGALLAATVRADFLPALSYHRGAICAWLQSLAAAGPLTATEPIVVPEPVLDGLSALASRLHGLMDLVGTPPPPPPLGGPLAAGPDLASGGPAGKGAASASYANVTTAGWLRTEWTSALSSKPQRMLRLDTLPQELAMVYTVYAAALRLSALQRLAETAAATAFTADGGDPAAAALANGPETSGGSQTAVAASLAQAALTAAVATLRRAAGVYGFLAEALLPELRAGAAPTGDRPLELLAPAARAMQQLCLAEAQALVASAAATKGLSAGAQRALHAGCTALFRQVQDAAAELAAAAPPGLPASDRLTRLAAASAALQAALSYRCLALDRQKAMELGEAEACCEESSRLLEEALRRLDRLDPPGWAELVKAQKPRVVQLLAAVQKDRLSVTYQPLPRQPPDALANPAIRVATDAFTPTYVVPPAPPAAEQAKGGCAIM